MDSIKKGASVPDRWSRDWIAKRNSLEIDRLGYAGSCYQPTPIPLPWPYQCLSFLLKATGLYKRGQQNFRDVRLVQLRQSLPRWPASLDGYRILQISDLHIDLDASLMEPLCRQLTKAQADLVVFTGDYWEGSNTSFEEALVRMRILLESIPAPRDGFFGVLGNHDPVALGAELEAMGLKILVNESVTVASGSAAFSLAGIDDAYFFKLDDLAAAATDCPATEPRILLSHSPQIAREANATGFDLMLSGHTHGGQVCLPGGRSLVQMDKIPVPLFRGPWRYSSLRGYTTTGAGACHLPVRYNCPPEIVLHTLTGETGSGGYSGE